MLDTVETHLNYFHMKCPVTEGGILRIVSLFQGFHSLKNCFSEGWKFLSWYWQLTIYWGDMVAMAAMWNTLTPQSRQSFRRPPSGQQWRDPRPWRPGPPLPPSTGTAPSGARSSHSRCLWSSPRSHSPATCRGTSSSQEILRPSESNALHCSVQWCSMQCYDLLSLPTIVTTFFWKGFPSLWSLLKSTKC